MCKPLSLPVFRLQQHHRIERLSRAGKPRDSMRKAAARATLPPAGPGRERHKARGEKQK